ncbi:MAG: CIA30 family protein [Planctomycetes bacterium]|nr:CIA30 family protein [Planctomycetota bacterium]
MPKRSSTLASVSIVVLASAAGAQHPVPAEPAVAIPALVEQRSSLRTLARLLERAELTAALAARGPFTLFAPTERAFRRVDALTLQGLVQPGCEDELADLLRAHVVAGVVRAADLRPGAKLTTLGGGAILVGEDGALVGAEVTTADLAAGNGIVHEIDSVLLPRSPETRSATDPELLFGFDGPAGAGGWQQIHDSVMGGRSDGGMTAVEGGIARFAGEVSLANNGGFASIQTVIDAGRMAGARGVKLRVRGDGRRYILALRGSRTYGPGSYWFEFDTEPGKWLEIDAPIDAFDFNFMGQYSRGRHIAADKVRGLAFYIYDKKAGPFALDIDWIRFYRGGGRTVVR